MRFSGVLDWNTAKYYHATYQRHPVYQKALSGLQAKDSLILFYIASFSATSKIFRGYLGKKTKKIILAVACFGEWAKYLILAETNFV